jgi:hypothetical protein
VIVRPGPGAEHVELHPLAFHDYPLADDLVACVVPVGRHGEVAVVSFEDALVPLRVDEHGAARREAIVDVVPAIAGGDLSAVHPAAPGQVCTYLQSRRMIRYDLVQRAPRVVPMTTGESLVIHGMWLSGQEDRIAVQVEDTSRYDEGGLVLGRVELFDLRAARPARVGAAPLPRARAPGLGWAAGAGLVAIAEDGGLTLLDAAMQPLDEHPLARAIRPALADVGAAEVHALRIHPTEPLALLAACTSERMGVRDFALLRASWSAAGPAEVRLVATLHAVGDLAFGAFAPGRDALDVRVATGGVTWLFIVADGRTLHDLGPSRGTQGACWSGPRHFLAFERSGAQIVVWALPGVGS